MVELPRNAQAKRSVLLADLRSLAQRGGIAIGEAYARAASSFLTQLERVEDRRAERRFRQRAQAVRGADRSALGPPPSPKPPTITARSSGPP
jgi:hypothetical protein